MLDPFYKAVAHVIVWLHNLLAPAFGTDSGLTWGLSIVLLVVSIRILLFPLFVKQIKTQRKMMEIQPLVKELQTKYRGDRETLNQELMKLYREHNANPLGGCLPLLIQMPIFLALFRVLNSFKPNARGMFSEHYGIPADLVQSAAQAKIFGAPIASSFRSSALTLHHLDATPGVVRSVTLTMIVLMSASTFLTQRQLMARNAASASASTPMAQQQKILLYILPLFFGVFGLNFPVGVLLYWLTTNIWSMGQQFLVINRMHPAPGAAAAGGGAAANGARTKPAPTKGPATTTKGPKPTPRPLPADGPAASPGPSPGSSGSRPAGRQQPRRKNRKNRRGGRR
ncbi:MAG: membrane protein insertase YidC [Actinomycetes bacterium]